MRGSFIRNDRPKILSPPKCTKTLERTRQDTITFVPPPPPPPLLLPRSTLNPSDERKILSPTRIRENLVQEYLAYTKTPCSRTIL